MNQSLAYAGDTSSMGLGKADLHYISELERDKQECEVEIKKLQNQLEKN